MKRFPHVFVATLAALWVGLLALGASAQAPATLQAILNPPCSAITQGSALLLCGEVQGLALDFTGNNGLGSVTVKDTTTAANGLVNQPVDSFLTQSGTSPKLVLWSDGLYRWTAHNQFLRSETLDNASWTKNNATVVADASGTLDKIAEDNTTNFHYVNQIPTTIAAATYTVAVVMQAAERSWGWIFQSAAGSHIAYFDLANGVVGTVVGGSATITSLGGGQYLCAFTATSDASNAPFGFGPGLANGSASYLGTTGSGIYAGKAQLNRGTVPTAYHVTTSAAWYTVPIEYDGVSKFDALVEPQATNLALQSSDFTNASWTKSNMTTALTATGPDGVANSASTLTATAGNATALQAITSASASRVTSAFIKRRTGSGEIDLTQDNGGTWTSVAVTSSWTRLPIAAVTSANPTVGIRLVVNGDAVDVTWFQHELTAVTSPVPTFAAAVTRSADSLAITKASIPYSATTGSWVADITSYTVPSNGRIIANGVDVPTGNSVTSLFMASNTAVAMYNGAVALSKTVTSFTNVRTKMASSWDGSGRSVTAQGLAPATDAGTQPDATAIKLGIAEGGGSAMDGRIFTLLYVPRRMTNAELQAKTT